jgi:anaerobic magnesium-protoporphyrin IX monomethyl ester cyclase
MTSSPLTSAPRVALINPKATYADEIAQKCFPPLGLLYLAASLEAAGIDVQVIDANALRASDDSVVDRLRRFGPSVVGMPLYAETLCAGATTMRSIRAALPDATLIAGGPQASATPAWVLDQVPEADFVLAGEAEETLPRFVTVIETGRRPREGEIPGLHGRGLTAISEAPKLRDIDAIPSPARRAVEEVYSRKLYYALLVPHRQIDCIVTSRGCPFRCHFCYNASQQVRYRSIDRCLDELEELRSKGIRTVEILDDNFTTSEGRALELLERIRRQRWGLSLRIKSRANSVTERLMAAARRAGVYQVSIGAESGSPALLEAMNKRITVEQLQRAVQLVMNEGINCHTNWIVGYPGETRQTLSQTLELVKRMKPTTAGFTVLTPYPGTHVYEQARRDGTLVGDWSANSTAAPWIRLPWTRSRSDLVEAKTAMMRRIYFRPHYAGEYAKRILGGANWTLARYAAQELRRALRWRSP